MRQRALPSIRCDSEGYFEPIQCVNATYCYCVDREYGQRRSGPHTREEAQGLCQAGESYEHNLSLVSSFVQSSWCPSCPLLGAIA